MIRNKQKTTSMVSINTKNKIRVFGACVFFLGLLFCFDVMAQQVLQNPLGPGTPPSPQVLIGRAVRYLFGVAGSLALLNFVIAGIRMMLAQGVPDKVNAAKKSMQYTIMGLVMMFTSYAIIRFVLTILQTK